MRAPRRGPARPTLALSLGLAVAALLATTASTAQSQALGQPTIAHLQFFRWGDVSGAGALRAGTFAGTRVRHGLVLARHTMPVTYRDPYGRHGRLHYGRGRWTSPWHSPGFGLTQLIASYDAATPVGSFIEVSARGRATDGRVSSWDSLGRWASHGAAFHRMSLGAQRDDLSRVAVDTVITRRGVRYEAWQLRVDLFRRSGSGVSPTVRTVGAVASRLAGALPATSAPGPGAADVLAVPRYSQMIHRGEYPRWNGGGEAWCSPTSTAMVLAFWKRGPTPRQYAWVKHTYRQPWVDYAARETFAWGYDGTGDWPFNTAYAARFGLDTFVTRLPSLTAAEGYIATGTPLVASISFRRGRLDGAPIRSSNGHLVVIRGFTGSGDVVVNDPAALTAKGVRRVYDRRQFEHAWLGGSGGMVYVIRPG